MVKMYISCLSMVKIRCALQGYVVQGGFIVVRHYRDTASECQIIRGCSDGLKISWWLYTSELLCPRHSLVLCKDRQRSTCKTAQPWKRAAQRSLKVWFLAGEDSYLLASRSSQLVYDILYCWVWKNNVSRRPMSSLTQSSPPSPHSTYPILPSFSPLSVPLGLGLLLPLC